MSCGISLGVLTLEEVLNKAIPLTMSMAWQLGRAVRRAQRCHTSVLEAISAQQNGTVLVVGKVCQSLLTLHSLCETVSFIFSSYLPAK